MLIDVIQIISSELRELFFVLEDFVVARDEVEAPCTQLGGIVQLGGEKNTLESKMSNVQ